MKTYYDAAREALNSPALPNCSMTQGEIEEAISAITAKLRGPLSDVERLLLVADRSELRATLKVKAEGN